jgi:hypothetical protein
VKLIEGAGQLFSRDGSCAEFADDYAGGSIGKKRSLRE